MNFVPLSSVVNHFGVVNSLLIEKGESILADIQELVDCVNGTVTLFKGKMGVRKYELIVVKGYDLESKLLQTTYHALENSGQLIFVLNNSDEEIFMVKQTIEDANFVAVNDIEMDGFHVVIAKKMHGWSGGM
jgi:hypothetical protein